MRFNLTTASALTLALGLSAALIGCGDSNTDSPSASRGVTASDSALPAGLVLDHAPEGARTVAELKASAKEGDKVVVRVVVGGRGAPMVDGRAAMTVVEAGLNNACLGEDDHCPTPWDYCCAAPEDLTANMATVQVVDADGRPLAVSLGDKIGPLAILTVEGVVGPRPDANALVINATGIYVEQPTRQ